MLELWLRTQRPTGKGLSTGILARRKRIPENAFTGYGPDPKGAARCLQHAACGKWLTGTKAIPVGFAPVEQSKGAKVKTKDYATRSG